MDKLDMKSPSIVNMNIEKIAELFPNCVVESEKGRVIDYDMLKQELSHDIVEGQKEKYQITWPGKKEAIVIANTPTTNTLRPVREKSVDFDNTQNVYIEGDNLEALKILQESYLGKIKCIYIDPPYNTGNDFVYDDKFYKKSKEELKDSGVIDESGNVLISKIINNESDGKFHSNWLSMMYPRLKIARNLLSEEGVLFISIDDNEVDNLKKICIDIFGEKNFVGCAGRITKKSNNKGDFWAPNFDYILTFAKNIETAKPFIGEANVEAYNLVDEEGARAGEKYQLVRLYMSSLQNRNPEQRFWIECPDGSKIIPPGKTFPPERPILGDGIWRWSKSTYEANIDKIVIKRVNSSNLIDENGKPAKWNVFTKTYLNDVIEKASAKPNSFIENHINQNASHELNKLDVPFDYAKPTSLIKYLMAIAKVDSDDIVLDFFAGSSSTADAVIQLNSEDNGKRKNIMIQLPEITEEKTPAYKNGYKSICDIGEERIRRAGKKIKEETNADIDYGFRVYKIDSSNMKDVYYTPSEINQKQLDIFTSNIKEDRTPEDILTQIILDWGLTLDLPIGEKEIKGNKVFYVAENSLVACLDNKIDINIIDEIAKCNPVRVVFRDEAFTKDSDKINVYERLKKLSPKTEVKVI
jgi:adenine-specific DNA-methyltransferase